MEYETNISGGVLTVSLAGDLDERSARETRDDLDKLIDKYDFRAMVIDMGKVDFMDSTGIGVLLGRYKKLRALGAELLVKNVGSQTDKVFRVSGLYQIIKVV